MEAQGYMAFLFEASEPEEVLKAIVNRGADGVVIDARYASEAEALLKPAGIPFNIIQRTCSVRPAEQRSNRLV
jgi:hypothetical protein